MPREKPSTGIVGAIGQIGVRQPLHRRASTGSATPVEAREEQQVLARRELRIEIEIVAEQAEPRAERRAGRLRRVDRRSVTSPVDGASSVARMESSVDLPAPFGPSRPRISPALAVEGDLRERLAAAEVPPDVGDRDLA